MGARFKEASGGETLAQTLTLGSVMDAEQKITFDSSGTNKIFAEDAVGTQGILFNPDTDNDIYITGDKTNLYDYVFINPDTYEFFQGNSAGKGMSFQMFNGDATGDNTSAFKLIGSSTGGTNATYIYAADNTGFSKTTPSGRDAGFVVLSSRGATVNANVNNAVILGGVGITANKSNYAFVQNLEIQGGVLRYSATPALATALDMAHRGYVDTMLPLAGGTITGDVTITDSNLILSATTGTQIGTATTQKLSLWGATPIVQPTALTAAETTLTFVDENTPDFALSSLTTTTPAGFATLDEAQAFVEVVANLQTRVQELEDKLQALGAIA